MKLKIARRARQVIFVGGTGPVPNRLSHDFQRENRQRYQQLNKNLSLRPVGSNICDGRTPDPAYSVGIQVPSFRGSVRGRL